MSRPGDPLYRLPLGSPDQGTPAAQGAPGARSYQNGIVAVHPGDATAQVDMGAAGTITLSAVTAGIYHR